MYHAGIYVGPKAPKTVQLEGQSIYFWAHKPLGKHLRWLPHGKKCPGFFVSLSEMNPELPDPNPQKNI